MLAVRLSDGLGNQMFQYAFGKALSERNSEPVKYDISWFDNRDLFGGTERTLTLDQWDTSIEYATESDIRSIFAGLPNSAINRIIKYGYWFERIPNGIELAADYFNYYREIRDFPSGDKMSWPHRRISYKPILDIEGDGYFDGYWGSVEYLNNIEDTIRDDFSIPDGFEGLDAEIADEIVDSTAISIHVRRGDKLSQGPKSDPLGNALPVEYYNRAVNHIKKGIDSNPHYFVFSNDPNWAKNNINITNPTTYVTHNDGSTDYIDLALMSNCDHHIIANSSFSWWAAWLNPSSQKIVVAPRPWTRFGYPTGSLDRWEFLPADWTTIEYDVNKKVQDHSPINRLLQ